MDCPITKLFVTDDVSLVSIRNSQNTILFLDELFDAIYKENINLDMITQPYTSMETVDISFTVSDDDIAKIITILGNFKKKYPRLMTEINSGNTKLAIYGEEMPKYSGVAASLFKVLANADIPIKMITTSDTDISILVDHLNQDRAEEEIKKRYNL